MTLKRILGIGDLAKTLLSVAVASATQQRSPEEQAAIDFQLDYDITKPDALRLIDALGIAEAERRLKRAKELRVDIFHPSVTGDVHIRERIDA